MMNALHRMNASRTNAGGWPGSEMRSFLNGSVLTAIPRAWRGMMAEVQVRSSAGSGSPEIVSSNDRLFLLSRAELEQNCNTMPYAQEIDEDAEESAFSAFTDSASRVRRYFNGLGDAGYWWTRSPAATEGVTFYVVSSSGAVLDNTAASNATTKYGVSWVCCMGGEAR